MPIAPDPTRTLGMDISHWDGIVDLAASKARGIKFVFIKGMDGTIQTRYYVENYTTAIQVGLPVAPYAWLYRDANVRATSQAQALHNLNQRYPPTLPSVIDFETTRYLGVPASPNFTDLRKWVTEFLRLGNPKPLLYSSYGFMNQYGEMPSDLRDMFAGLWIANYGVSRPTLPLGWTSWTYWQFTDQGDASYYAPNSVDTKELDLNYSSVPLPPTGDNTVSTRYEVTAISDGTRLRVNHNTVSNYIGLYPAGTKFYGDVKWVATAENKEVSQFVGDIWIQVTSINNTPTNGWVAVRHQGGTICTLVDNGEPVPPTSTPHTVDVLIDGVNVFHKDLD